MSALRTAARVTLNSPRLLAAAAVAAVGETAVRVALAWVLSPVVALVVPPVVAVVALGVAAPSVREAVDGTEPLGAGVRDGRPGVGPLVGIATAGHAVAVGAGTALFLLVDTPIRAALYWLGKGGLLGLEVQFLAPLTGVAAGTLLAWAVVAVAAVRVVDGTPIGAALGDALGAAVEAPRATAVAAGVHLAFVLAVLGAVGVGLRVLLGTRSPVAFVAVGGALVVLVSAFGLSFLAAFHLARPATGDGGRGSPVPVARVAVAGLLIAGLVAGAVAVRTAELRPRDAAPDPLPEDPDALYATAVENTARADHRYRVAVGPDRPEPFVVERRVDRSDRQYQQRTAGEAVGPSVYASTGTGSPPLNRRNPTLTLGTYEVGPDGDRTVRAFPDYLLWTDSYEWDRGGLVPPSTDVEGWTIVERDDRRIVLELTDPTSVFAATQGRRPDGVSNVSAARIRAVVDAERGTLVRVDQRFDATITVDGSTHRIDGRVAHEFEVGYDVRRPDVLGTPTAGEWLWKAFVY